MIAQGAGGISPAVNGMRPQMNNFTIDGIDNNMRRDFFGEKGDTLWNQQRLLAACRNFTHYSADIRDRVLIQELIQTIQPDLIVHAAAQPSHDLAASRPFDDFDVNAVGTLNLLQATRQHKPDAVFVYMSTNKVYGDSPNEKPLGRLRHRGVRSSVRLKSVFSNHL